MKKQIKTVLFIMLITLLVIPANSALALDADDSWEITASALNTTVNATTYALDTCGFSVDTISGKDTFVNKGCHTTYAAALAQMNTVGATDNTAVIRHNSVISPLKIVAAYQGVAYSFPINIAASTISIFTNEGLTTKETNAVYLSNYYPLDYTVTANTSSNTVGNFSAYIMVQGAAGYVDLDAIDIVPMIYVLNGWTVTSSNDVTYTPYQTNYVVSNGRLTMNYRQAGSSLNAANMGSISTSVPNGTYYSWDGLTFYTDRFYKNPLKVNNAVYTNTIYYRDLYLRSKTTVTGEQLDNYLKSVLGANYADSKMAGKGQAFIDAQEKYGVNALIVYAIAINESGWGRSTFAKERNNLFGINAVDSDPDKATYFTSIEDCISQMMGSFLTSMYLDFQWNYYGSQLGTKPDGIGRRYASDPFWSTKAIASANNINTFIGGTDENSLQVAKLNSKAVSIYADTNGSKLIHNYSQSYTNSISVVILEEIGAYYKINLTTPLKSDGTVSYPSSSEVTEYNWTTNIGYVKKTDVKLLNASSGNDVTVVGSAKDYMVFDGPLNVRAAPSISGTKIGSLAVNTIVNGQLMSNGWIKITYNNAVGYISGDFVNEYTDSTVKGDLNGDGKISTADIIVIRRHLLGIEVLSGNNLANADLNGDGKISTADIIVIRRHLLGIELMQ